MAKAIKTIHDRINLAMKKGLTGYFSPTKIDDEIYAEILNLWKKYVQQFEETRIINVYLNPFIKPEDKTPNGVTGGVALANAYQYPVAIRVKANGKTVTEVDQARWDRMINHPIEFPTADYPICKFENKFIWARPTNIGELTISYIARPIKPVYAFTQPGGRYVYDDTNSVDLEFDPILHDDIVNRVLKNLGISTREEFIVRVSEQDKMTEGR